MTVKLSSLAVDLVLEEKGDWIDFPEWPGVAFNVSSIHKHAYAAARDLALSRLARKYKGQPIPAEERAKVVGALYARHLLHGWRGLDVEYSPEVALSTLRDPAFRQVVNAIEWCANQVGQSEAEYLEDETGNSGAPSAIK